MAAARSTALSLALHALRIWQEHRAGNATTTLAPPLRIGHVERQATSDRLLWGLEHGYLTITEFEERSATVLRARFAGDLAPLTADFPEPPVVETSRRWWRRRQ